MDGCPVSPPLATLRLSLAQGTVERQTKCNAELTRDFSLYGHSSRWLKTRGNLKLPQTQSHRRSGTYSLLENPPLCLKTQKQCHATTLYD
ncbi:MAG: hypothetical protein MHM6MM_005696 [Cercozoa sp. M6MM]